MTTRNINIVGSQDSEFKQHYCLGLFTHAKSIGEAAEI